MVEIRKTDIFAKWIDGLRDIRARARVLDNAWHAGTLVMLNPLAREYRKCELTMDLDIGSTTKGKGSN